MKRVLFVAGTRPEVIKLAPLVHEFRRQPTPFQVHVCCTGQQLDLLQPIWRCFRLEPEFSLRVMRHGQGLAGLCARLLDAVTAVLETIQPHIVMVQGDTATTLCAAQAAFYQRVPVAHVEAGLRTYDLHAPFPEELHRVAVSRMATLHFAPTRAAAENLLREGAPSSSIHITGNTGIDALLHVLQELDAGNLQPAIPFPKGSRKRIVATMHRRESFLGGLQSVCRALNTVIAEGDVELVIPLHPNPQARSAVQQTLQPHPRVHLCPPLDYVSFLALIRDADLLLTDSGGIQEEAPYLGIPVVVLRQCTERPEGVAAGVASMLGFHEEMLVETCKKMLTVGRSEPPNGARHGIYGDGAASTRIRTLTHSFLSK